MLGSAAALLVLFGYGHWANTGLRELDLALPLVANARSWHVTHTTSLLKVEEDVVCPFEYDATTTIGHLSKREVHAGHFYYTQLPTGQWSSREGNDFGHCSGGPQINNLGLAISMRVIRESGRISRGSTKEIGGRSCRVWNVLSALPTGGFAEQAATLCIDPETHYPLELASGGEAYQFSRWNEVSTIQVPQIDTAVVTETPNSVLGPDAGASHQ